MANEWTEAWAEAQASVPANIVELYTLELLHPAIIDELGNPISIRAVRDTQDHVLTLEGNAPLNPGDAVTFTAISFEIPWPEIQEGQVPELIIRIDNIGREIVPYLESAVQIQAPLTIIFRVYLFDTVAGTKIAGITPISFPLRSVTVTESYVEGSASPADLANLRAMRLVYDLQNYPGLDIAG
ncbi:MAG: Transcriptional regulator [Hyphomicrobiales bacterium]|nr:Transcriptional regulator [Hyphomicrobiales bacterium]